MGRSKDLFAEERQETVTNSLEILKTPLTKPGCSDIVNKTVQLIIDGEIDPIKAELQLKAMENIIKDIRSNNHVKRIVREETQKHGKSFDMFGVTIENCQRTIFDYTGCKDEVYNSLIAERDRIDEQIKIRESQIKSGVNAETGEVFNPPTSKTTDFLKISFK
jgi:hypothetical protein